ncbi:hypothetical protein GJ496_011491 [Pomphorhynchus laevis]|nr:hypothetical protein GJ496_011491 [Pomphorhynchus laevis]
MSWSRKCQHFTRYINKFVRPSAATKSSFSDVAKSNPPDRMSNADILFLIDNSKKMILNQMENLIKPLVNALFQSPTFDQVETCPKSKKRVDLLIRSHRPRIIFLELSIRNRMSAFDILSGGFDLATSENEDLVAADGRTNLFMYLVKCWHLRDQDRCPNPQLLHVGFAVSGANTEPG